MSNEELSQAFKDLLHKRSGAPEESARDPRLRFMYRLWVVERGQNPSKLIDDALDGWTGSNKKAVSAAFSGALEEDLAALSSAPGKPAEPSPGEKLASDYFDYGIEVANQILGTEAPKIDREAFNALVTEALANLQHRRDTDPARQLLIQMAQGKGPAADAARAQLNAGLDAANRQAISQAATARGGSGARGAVMRGAIQAGAENSQTAANKAAELLAQMALTGTRDLSASDQFYTSREADIRRDQYTFEGDAASKDAANQVAHDIGKWNSAHQWYNTSPNMLESKEERRMRATVAGVTAAGGVAGSGAAQEQAGINNAIGGISAGVNGAIQAVDAYNNAQGEDKGSGDGKKPLPKPPPKPAPKSTVKPTSRGILLG
jgi:hypothetical protein